MRNGTKSFLSFQVQLLLTLMLCPLFALGPCSLVFSSLRSWLFHTLPSSLSFNALCLHLTPRNFNEDAKWLDPLITFRWWCKPSSEGRSCRQRMQECGSVRLQCSDTHILSIFSSMISMYSLISILSSLFLPLQNFFWRLSAWICHLLASFLGPQSPLYHSPVPINGYGSTDKKWASFFSLKTNFLLKPTAFCLKTRPCFSATFQNRCWIIQ